MGDPKTRQLFYEMKTFTVSSEREVASSVRRLKCHVFAFLLGTKVMDRGAASEEGRQKWDPRALPVGYGGTHSGTATALEMFSGVS